MESPAYPTTGIGSVPFDKINKSLDYSFAHGLPFLPEQIYGDCRETMEMSIRNSGNLSCLRYFKERAMGEGRGAIKMQCPDLTTAKYFPGIDEQAKRIWDHSTYLLRDLKGVTVYFFFDSPAPEVDDAYLEWFHDITTSLRTDFQHLNLKFGIHTCGSVHREKIFYIPELEVVAVDARPGNKVNIVDVVTQAKMEAFHNKHGQQEREMFHMISKDDVDWRNGKAMAWGIEKADELPVEHFRRGDLITAPCGLAGLEIVDDPEKACYEVLNYLEEAARSAYAYLEAREESIAFP